MARTSFGVRRPQSCIIYTDPLGATETYEYDGLGNLISERTAQGQQTVYEYDALNRIEKVTYADTSTITIT